MHRCALSPFRSLGSGTGAANGDPLRLSNLNTVYSVIDTHLDEHQRHRLYRIGNGLLAIRHLRNPCCLTLHHHHVRHHLLRCSRISKSDRGGDRGADACDWYDSSGYGHGLRLLNSNAECARDRLRGAWQPGRGHRRSGEQLVYMVAGIL